MSNSQRTPPLDDHDMLPSKLPALNPFRPRKKDERKEGKESTSSALVGYPRIVAAEPAAADSWIAWPFLVQALPCVAIEVLAE
jgi:hypothetical protein